MPGMMGGLGGMLGGMVRGGMGGGMGGPGGMGGGMGGPGGMGGGMGGPGGMGMQTNNASQDVFDVDRWKRTDDVYGYDSAPSYSESYASRYEQEKKKGKLRKALEKSKLFSRFASKKKNAYDPNRPIYPGHAQDAPMDRYASRNTSEHVRPRSESKRDEIRKNAEKSIPEKEGLKEGMDPHSLPGLDPGVGQSSFHHFFTSNPINSIILSGDCLSSGPLLMNQVVKDGGRSFDTWSHDSKTGYMDGLKEQKIDKRYTARIVSPDGE